MWQVIIHAVFLISSIVWRYLKEFYTRNIKPCSLKIDWVKTKICSILKFN